MKEVKDSTGSRSWFCVWDNPQNFYVGMEPQEMAEAALDTWISAKPTRSGAVAYCISARGLIHFHMVLEDDSKPRFSALKKLYPHAHLEPTIGNKEQAEDYINKRGKYEEKGEQVVYIAQYGKIKGAQGQRRDLEVIQDLLDEGKTPGEIFEMSLHYRRYEKMIKDAYFDKRKKETPFERPVKVVWHVGESGSGKTYSVINLVKEHGEGDVYMISDYEKGGLDRYCGEHYLFLDEFRGQLRYSLLLAMLQGYKQQFYARYTNVYGLWDEVHISSVLPPEMVYSRLVKDDKDVDTFKQLKRRLSEVVYHWIEDGEFKQFTLSAEKYTTYEGLKISARGMEGGFLKLEEYEQIEIPFD